MATTAIIPEPQGDQHHYALAFARFATTNASIWLLLFGLALDSEPDAIQLHHARHIRDRFTVGLQQ